MPDNPAAPKPQPPTETPTLEPLRADRSRIERIVARLEAADEPTERADLASELSRSASRYEHTVEQVLALHPQGTDQEQSTLEDGRRRVRDALTIIHERTMHTDPRNVHTGDPDGFERAIEASITALKAHLSLEDACLRRLVQASSAAERDDIAGEVRRAARTASERPHPPRTAVGRMVSNLNVKLDHTLEDVANPRHPGADTIEGR